MRLTVCAAILPYLRCTLPKKITSAPLDLTALMARMPYILRPFPCFHREAVEVVAAIQRKKRKRPVAGRFLK